MPLGRREALILGAVGVAAAAAGVVVGPLIRSSDRASAALQAATFKDLAGKPHQLGEWKGRVVVCNFWATWCAPCREEIPMLIELSKAMASKGVEIVGIAVDNASKVRDFSRDYKITYPILIADASGLDVMRAAGNEMGGLPYTVFLDRRGKIAHRKLGALRQAEVDHQLESMLGS